MSVALDKIRLRVKVNHERSFYVFEVDGKGHAIDGSCMWYRVGIDNIYGMEVPREAKQSHEPLTVLERYGYSISMIRQIYFENYSV